MALKQQFNKVLEKEMDRRDFLKHIGIAAAALVGLPAILKALSGDSFAPSSSTPSLNRNAYGYGASVYGGTRR